MAVQLDDQMLHDPAGRITGIRATMQDITERRLIEGELKENQIQLVEAQHIALLGSWTWNIATNTSRWSAAMYHIYGTRPEDCPATYEGYLSLVHPDDREQVSGLVETAVRTGDSSRLSHRPMGPPHANMAVQASDWPSQNNWLSFVGPPHQSPFPYHL